MLAMLDNVQPAADVSMNDSALNASRTDAVAAQAAVNTAAADLNSSRGRVRARQARLRSQQGSYDAQLIAKSDYDTKKARFRYGHCAVGRWPRPNSRRPRPSWILPRAISARTPPCCATPADVLSKTEYPAPVRWRHHQRSRCAKAKPLSPASRIRPGSTLMTIADMSMITAEVKVDESDIVNVQIGPAGRGHHRRHSEAEVQRHGDRDRQKRGAPLHRSLHRADHLQRPGSQRLQGGRRAAGSAAEPAARIVGDGAHHHRDP